MSSCRLILVSNLWQIEAIKAVSTAPAADIAAATGAATRPAIAGRLTLISVWCNATAAAATNKPQMSLRGLSGEPRESPRTKEATEGQGSTRGPQESKGSHLQLDGSVFKRRNLSPRAKGAPKN